MIATQATHEFALRLDTQDILAAHEQFAINQYRLPDHMGPGDVVLDIGAHCGTFAFACLARGAGHVICVEPDDDNFRLLKSNLAPYAGRTTLLKMAAWRSDRAERITFSGYPGPYNACGTCLPGYAVNGMNLHLPVTAISFDRLVALAVECLPAQGGKVTCKMDCEGAEWYCLLTSKNLKHIDRLVGEIHEWPNLVLPLSTDPARRCVLAEMVKHLESAGFQVETVQPTESVAQYVFFADR